uniref:Retrotransposon gag domain-containing protein n=1 Tax=Romanomermis culicivorax TaxID=13658 RepID=A0A915HIW7_ROMCU
MYPEGRDSDVHQQLICDRKQKSNENIMEYLDKLRKLARSAYPTLKEEARDMIIKPIFIRGLQPGINEGLKYRDFTTLGEAAKAA